MKIPDDEGDAPQRGALETVRASAASRKQVVIICALIFLVTFCARVLYWHSGRADAAKVESMATAGYKDIARHINRDGFTSFFSPSSPLASPNTISYQPGYSLLMALFFRLFGERDAALQFFQMMSDAAAALMVFLIAAELLPVGAAIVGGVLAALCPQFSWYSIVLLPDSMGVLPILAAVYCLIRARKRPRAVSLVIIAGLLIGLSCWLRANGLLLAPFLAITLIPILFERGRRLRYALTLVGCTVLVLAPLFIRNWVIHGYFPVFSLRAGNTMVEGIADYDTEGRFGLPRTDLSLMKWESEIYNRPDYYGNLFEPDGIERERMRLRHGLAVIRSHPFWFAGVMVRRAASMLRLGRVHLISTQPPVTHTLETAEASVPIWADSPADMLMVYPLQSPQAKITLTPDFKMLHLTGDESKYGDQLASVPIPVEKNHDYLLTLPIQVEQGRMTVNVLSEDRSISYASTVVEAMEGRTPEEQPLSTISLPFVSRNEGRVQVVFSNGASKPAPPIIRVGWIKVFSLGAASYLWTRYPRLVLWLAQRLFITAVMLPLAILGATLLLRARRWRVLALLLAVPAYYFCVQSALHTEYRYVLSVHYFLFMLAALALYWLGRQLWRKAFHHKGTKTRRIAHLAYFVSLCLCGKCF